MIKAPVFTFILLFALLGCSSQKKLVDQTPFTVDGPSCQDFAAGREEGGSGFTLNIPITGYEGNVTFGEVYFRGHVLQPTLEQNEKGTTLVCVYKNESPGKMHEIVMHADPTQEIGNQPPSLQKSEPADFPFELGKDEAVISYLENGKKKKFFYKIKEVKEKLPLVYPSRPKN